MKVDARLEPQCLADTPAMASRIEYTGYDGAFTAESRHDGVLPLVLAAEHTSRLRIGTGVVVALARNPLSLAHAAHDLQCQSKGRLVLGLGTQVRVHAERRFGVDWDRPVERLREFTAAMRAIWAAWERSEPLHFIGKHYRHVLMPPFFQPEPHGLSDPPILWAAVGPRMTEAAAADADGIYLHDFTTRHYVEHVTLPAVDRGLAASGRARSSLEVVCPVILVTGSDADGWEQASARARRTIAFHGSTPSYRRVLAAHGWEALHDELNILSRMGRWTEMPTLIDDHMLEAFAVVAEPEHLADAILRRYEDYADRVRLTIPPGMSAATERDLVAALQAA